MTRTPDTSRALLALDGEDALHFLQGILTQDMMKLGEQKIQFASLLSPQGKILHDMFVIDGHAVGHTAQVLIDTPRVHAPLLLKRLAIYKLRAKVMIRDISSEWHVAYGAQGLADPRHAELPHRHYVQGAAQEDAVAIADYQHAQRALGIPDSATDFAPDSIVALDAGYDLLHGVSFTKGCYVGQEVTARMHYKQIARKGFYLLTHEGSLPRLVLLKFDDVGAAEGKITFDNVVYEARLPEWMTPKFTQFQASAAK